MPCSERHPHRSALILRFLTLQAVRTNEQTAEAVLKDIQNLAEIVEGSKSGLENRIVPLSDAGQKTAESEFADSTAVRDRFSQFHEYVPTVLAIAFVRDIDVGLRDLNQLEVRSEDLRHKWYIPSCFFSSQDADVIRDIQDGVSKATTYFQVTICVGVLASSERG